MASTIPMLIIAGIAFVPLEREIPQDVDTNLDCGRVKDLIEPAIVPAANFKFNCVLIPEPCSSAKHSSNKCSKPGDFWVQE